MYVITYHDPLIEGVFAILVGLDQPVGRGWDNGNEHCQDLINLEKEQTHLSVLASPT